MITTTRQTEFVTIASDRHVVPSLSCWESLKERFAAWYYTSPFCNVVCCTVPDTHWDLSAKRTHRVAVQRSLMENLDYYGKDSIIEAVAADVKLDGYDMMKDEEPKRTEREWDMLVLQAGLDPLTTPLEVIAYTLRRDLRTVRAVPRFTAAVVVAVRSKVGQMSQDVPGNALIVEREALRLMRKYKVREVDCVAHLPRIIAAYFSCDVHYVVETAEARMSRFHKWLRGVKPRPTAFAPLA